MLSRILLKRFLNTM